MADGFGGMEMNVRTPAPFDDPRFEKIVAAAKAASR
jgi:hypothetical protein